MSDITYIDLNSITPGQNRYSSKVVEEKKEVLLDKKHVKKKKDRYVGKYDVADGITSAFSEKKAFPVVKTQKGYTLVDGHHHVLAALDFDLPWIPITVTQDFSSLSEREVWIKLEELELVYLKTLEGQREIPTVFSHLEDDPNRYFTTFTARKCDSLDEWDKSKGNDYPLWVKVGKDIPFIEFKISDIFYSKDIYYHYDMDDPKKAFVEAARPILINAHIEKLHVVPERTYWKDIHFDETLVLAT